MNSFIKQAAPADDLYQAWIDAKQAERDATDTRRALEDRLVEQFGITEDTEGVQSFEPDGYKVKVTCRMSRKVDADAVQEIAAEHGLTDMLGKLFRWKPEINASAWKAADAELIAPLNAAITVKPGRPSFSISKD